MGRPRDNSAEYFPHLITLRNHRKVRALRNRYGQALGYAFWCMMLEWLTERDGLEWEYTDLEIEMFSTELGVSAAETQDMVNYCCKLGMLTLTESGFIYSESLNENLQPVFDKRKRERERSKSRKRKENGTFDASGGVSAAENPHSIVEYSREEESKEEYINNLAAKSGSDDVSVEEEEKQFLPEDEKKTLPKSSAKKVSVKTLKKPLDQYSLGFRIRVKVEEIHSDYLWSPKDAAATSDLIKKLKKSYSVSYKQEGTDEQIYQKFVSLVSKLPPPFCDAWTMTSLNSQYQIIVQKLKNGNTQQRTATSGLRPTGTQPTEYRGGTVLPKVEL